MIFSDDRSNVDFGAYISVSGIYQSRKWQFKRQYGLPQWQLWYKLGSWDSNCVCEIKWRAPKWKYTVQKLSVLSKIYGLCTEQIDIHIKGKVACNYSMEWSAQNSKFHQCECGFSPDHSSYNKHLFLWLFSIPIFLISFFYVNIGEFQHQICMLYKLYIILFSKYCGKIW